MKIFALIAALATSAVAGDCSSSDAKKKDIVSTAVEAGSFKTLATALTKAGLVEALQGDGPFTVFAPTDAAFAKLPKGTVATLIKPENRATLQGILKYHVVSGKLYAKQVMARSGARSLNGQWISFAGAKISATDIKCSNGVIHVIDEVLLPESKNLVQVAAGAGTFNTLLAAAKAAGLAGTLAEKGPYTLFAPTDAAFAKLPEGTVAALLKPENKNKLIAILKYHLVDGRVFAEDALEAGKVTIKDGKPMVGGARILATDVNASNGVVHIIDTVLIPPARQ